jgi:sugar/nucleoside kinase (ribokinase family)
VSGAVLCVGAALWDVVARAGRPLGPGSDVPGRIARQPGGVALNVALALAARGARPVLLAAVGRDTAGEALIAAASARGVDCAHALRHEGPSDAYVAIEDAAGEVFAAVADCAALERAGPAVLDPLRDGRLAAPGAPWTGAAVIDGNLPAATLAEVAALPALAPARLAFVPASPGKADRLAPVLAARRGAIYLNRTEAEGALGRGFPDSAAAALALRGLGLAEAVVTDGPAPASHAGPHGLVTRAPRPVATRSLTGAGDAFLAAHLAAVAAGRDPEAALAEALDASARHISREDP